MAPGATIGVAERVRDMGVHTAPALDLIAVGFSRTEADVSNAESTSRRLLDRFKVKGFGDITTDALSEIAGLDGFENLRCRALLELGRRAGVAAVGEHSLAIDTPEGVQEHLKHLVMEKREHFVAIMLDAQLNHLRTATIHVGTLTMSVVGPREVFREVIREGAASVIVAHNHPSGDPTPSHEDIFVTKQLCEAGKLLGIEVLDHMIIGRHTATSMKRLGHL